MPISKKTAKSGRSRKPSLRLPTWNLKLLYDSPTDPRIEADMTAFEKECADFAAAYDTADRAYLSDPAALAKALTRYEELMGSTKIAPFLYFHYLTDLDASDTVAAAHLARLENRLAKVQNTLTFFEISLAKIDLERQGKLLADPLLAHFKVFLSRIFSAATHNLSEPEEKVVNLLSQPAHSMWVSATERILNKKTVEWKGKKLPFPTASQLVSQLPNAKDRRTLAANVNAMLKEVAPFAEAELNAVFTDKKIMDELRGYERPFDQTVLHSYRNDPVVVESLVKTVSQNARIAHRFHKLKARLLKQKKLGYCDRAAKIGQVKAKFTFTDSVKRFAETLKTIDPKLADLLSSYVANGQIDVPPRVGKKSGAYCSSSYGLPTFVLLNHTDDLHSYTTLAHEMGHAFHGELSEPRGPIYSTYSYSLAETASTLFETLALDAIYDSLSENEKIIVLHDRINDDVATIFRQIACFNFENELHTAVRAKGYVSHEEIAGLHNAHMKAYLGPAFELSLDDGYMFVYWGHIRRFFYVYSYAYGQLVTKALLRRYYADKSFWSSIERFLSAGGTDSPENILREIGIDPASPGFWEEGLKEIEEDIKKLEKLTRK